MITPLEIGPVALSFGKRWDNSLDIAGEGHVSISGFHIADMEFDIDSAGVFFAHGRLDLGWFDADVTIEKRPGASLAFEARSSFSLDVSGASISAEVDLRFDGSNLFFHAAVSVELAGVGFSVGVTIGTDGCFDVDDVGTVCI